MPLTIRENFTPGAIPFAGPSRFLTENTLKLFFDNLNGRLGLGTVTPNNKLDISDNPNPPPLSSVFLMRLVAADGTQTGFGVQTVATNGVVGFTRVNGAAGVFSGLLDGQRIGSFTGAGYGSTAVGGTRAAVHFETEENWSDAAQGTRLLYNTTLNGAATPGGTERVRITNTGNFKIGITALRGTTESNKVLSLGDVTTEPAGTLVGGCSVYSASGFLKSIDKNGVLGHILSASAVNNVNPTAQNRTLTVDIAGTTYYITAKTTND